MDASKANQEVKQVVRDLLSRDPVQFNSTINAHFASSSTYQGRGLKITGASQLKHAAYLLNVLDFGSGTTITDKDVRWDAASSTAIVKATRHVRPAFFPLFQFAVPTKVILSFNAEEGAKDKLYCTQWKDEWPLEQLIRSVPVVRALYSSLLVPLLTTVFLWASNVAFWLHSKVETVEHRYARDAGQVYKHRVEPRLPHGLTKGFDHGVQAAEHVSQHSVRLISRVSHKPLKVVEELARTATVVSNLALPHQLQIPYPSVFAESADDERAKASEIQSKVDSFTKAASEKVSQVVPTALKSPQTSKVEGEGARSPKSKVSGSPSVDNATEQADKQPAIEPTQNDKPASSPDSLKPASDDAGEDHKRKAESSPSEEPRHAKVVIGPAKEDSQQPQAKEINLVTHEVTEKLPTESAKESLYQVLKNEDQLPVGDGSGGVSGSKKPSGKKKGKNGGRK